MKESFPEGKSDLFAAFIQRCTCLAGPQGLSAMITMQSWMFLSSFEKLRRTMLRKQWIASMLHLGTRAFDSIGGEVVSSAAFVIENVPPSRRATASARRGSFVRIVDGKSEAEKIMMLDRARHTREAEDGFHGASPEDFAVIPGSSIVYWLSEKMRGVFAEGTPLGEVAAVRQGLATGDNKRFVRLWWEVSLSRTTFDCESCTDATGGSSRWFPYNKGGEFRKWYGNQEYVLAFSQSDYELLKVSGNKLPSRDRYFSPSVSWSDISSGEAAFRRYPEGFIHANTGHSAFADPSRLQQIILMMNSTVSAQILRMLAPTLHFDIGYVSQVPIINGVKMLTVNRLNKLVAQSKRDWDGRETSWGFAQNALVGMSSGINS